MGKYCLEKFTTASVAIVIACSALCLWQGTAHSETPSPSYTQAHFSKEAFELELATKFQLARARLRLYRDLVEGFTTLAEIIQEKDSANLTEEEMHSILNQTLLPAGNAFAERLKALKNNPYVGARATHLLDLVDAGDSTAQDEEFGALFDEIHVDIEIAESLGLPVDHYRRELGQYGMDFVEALLWTSCVFSQDTDQSEPCHDNDGSQTDRYEFVD